MVYHPDEKPLDIGFSLTGLLLMHLDIQTPINYKLSFSDTMPKGLFSGTIHILVQYLLL